MATSAAAASLLVFAFSAAALAASEFEGVWKVADTSGKDYEITLSADGTAKGTQQEGQKGTWKEEGSAVVITWDTGWTTKISKEGGKFKKTAFKKGEPLTGTPTNSSPAEKVK
jgi:hypothetical protein